MTTPSRNPANDGDCFKLENSGSPVSEGSIPTPVGHPSRVMGKSVVVSVRRLSTISEQEPDKLDTDLSSQDPLGGSEWGGSSFSLCSDKYKNSSSRFSSDASYQPDSGDDCAAILLACLHCRFHDLLVMLPDTCERAMSRCFPSYKYVKASSEKDQQGRGCCSCNLELDCGCCSSCQDTAELLELAMEISEICYR
ncbi:myoD family inhibitor domain-containing protein 2-like [Centroberyx affinis]|uniref:myoD family inhibitor domain-containing protein 2-like n=1 Tax=Centroberyx affinis TaxID=166261 RepID=UPI003A5C1EAD